MLPILVILIPHKREKDLVSNTKYRFFLSAYLRHSYGRQASPSPAGRGREKG